jgi:nitrite reductase/ring-hydroxylating ferredoxin subunit
MKKYVFIACLITAVIILTSCSKEEEPPLPYVHVDFSFNLASYPGLLSGVPVKVNERISGYQRNGIIIFPMGFGDDAQFKAYDATCTHNISNHTSSIQLNNDNFTATCPNCKTVYLLSDGRAQNQNFRLQEYAARSGNGRLYVSNY